MKKIIITFFSLLLLISISFAQESTDTEGVNITIYNQNFGLVKDKRFFDLDDGIKEIRFSDVASQIEPTSVYFKSLSFPNACQILEQNYEYDLVGSSKLLLKYIDQKITILSKDGKVYSGMLMSFDDANIIIQDPNDKSLVMVARQDNIKDISFKDLPEGLITKPTLMWMIENDKNARHLVEVSYLTRGITWLCDYVTVVDKDDKNIDLSGWVTINNQSGTGYKNAGLKLIAGDVHRATREPEMMMERDVVFAEKRKSDVGFQEKAFFEYHMYTLGRKTTVKNNQTKQISLLNAADIPVQKLFIYDPALDYGWYYYREGKSTKEQKVKVKLEIKNSKENNLGMPFPKGNVKVYKKDTDGALEFIGEDSIDHTPKDEKIRLYLGDAFDVLGERKRMDYREFGKTADETIEISLRNHKEEDIEVLVVEHLWRYTNWEMTQKTHDFTKKDAQTVEFKIPVPKDKEVKLTYTVHYWWY